MQSLCAKSRCRDKVAIFFFFFFFACSQQNPGEREKIKNERLTLFIMTFMSKCTAHLPFADEKPTRKLLQDMEMVTKMRLVLFVAV